MIRSKTPNPPRHLKGRGRRWWLDMVRGYEGLDEDPAGLEILTSAAVQLMRADQARAEIDREGVVFLDRFEKPKEHPACMTERAATNLYRLLCRELGLEPVSDEDTRIPRAPGR